MNDRELLELAAKAWIRSGMRLECPDDEDGIYVCRDQSRNGHTWNPLKDDGDALRLAVRLHLDIEFWRGFCEVVVSDGDVDFLASEMYSDDMLAATRRAIVRAAAEIGKSMP